MSALKLVYKINREQRNEWKFRISHPFLFLEWERNMQEQMVRLKIFFRLYGIEHEDRKVNGQVEIVFRVIGDRKKNKMKRKNSFQFVWD